MSAQGPRQLVSWKEIADYLGRDVRTVVRWEKDKKLPVHRVPGGKRQAVYAFSDELDRWLRGEADRAPESPGESQFHQDSDRQAVRRRIRRGEWALLLGVGLICFSLLGFLIRPKPQVEPVLKLTRISTGAGIPGWPSVSPDGRQLAYTFLARGESKWQVYVQLIGAGEAVRIAGADRDEGAPAWSPNGRFLAFPAYDETGGETIVVAPALGGTPRDVVRVHDADAAWYVTWTPDGNGLVYPDRDAKDEPVRTWMVRLDSGERTQLFSAPDRATKEMLGRFSPDGRSFAFLRGTEFANALYVMPAAGGQAREVLAGHLGWGLAWTSDSREVLVQMVDAVRTQSSLMRVPAAGGTPATVFTSTSDVASPSTPVSGQGLLFQQYQQDANIWRVDLSHGAKTARVIDSVDREVDPACSPDGKRIAYLSYRDGSDIWVADADGTKARRLTFLADTQRENSGTPSWSPDGRTIVFSSSLNGRSQISFADVRTGEVRHLSSASNDQFPRWMRDGGSIVFSSDRGGSWDIWKISADGGAAEQVTRNGGRVAYESPDGKYLYYSKQKENGIWRAPISGGGEELVIPQVARTSPWTLAQNGIYFVQGSRFPDVAVRFYSFATGQITLVHRASGAIELMPAKLSACPDGKTLYVTQLDQVRPEIVWAENFR